MYWFVLSTVWKREREAAKRLKQQGFHVYLPLIRCYRKQSGNNHLTKTLVPVFERYLFVKMDWSRRSSVLATRGVKSFTGWSEGMARAPHVRPKVMAELQARLPAISETPRPQPEPERQVAAGQLIQILLGPYQDEIAQVEAVIGSKVKILLPFAGAQRAVTVAREQIRAA